MRPWLGILLLCGTATAATPLEHRGTELEREDLGTAALFAPTSPTAQKLMHGLLCQCPGCQPKRITIEDCACGYAARQREEVLGVLAGFDLATERGREAAEKAVRADQTSRYGRGVLAQPSTSMVWVFPMLGTMGALGLIVGLRRRRAPSPLPGITPADEELEERLDDELAAVD